MIALIGLAGVAGLIGLVLCLVLGTIAMDAGGAIGRGPRRPPETGYWSVR